jgi:hypothetical protein
MTYRLAGAFELRSNLERDGLELRLQKRKIGWAQKSEKLVAIGGHGGNLRPFDLPHIRQS